MKIHFIGIGGIGVSALAQYYLAKQNQVSGSDLFSSEITDELKKQKIKITIGKHKASNLPKKIDLVIYSPAVNKDNPEIKEARKRKIKCLSYPQALGELTKKYFTIAVSGTHGKSTTSSMLGLLFVKAKMDPTVIVGTKIKEFNNSNFRIGKSKYLIIEADEHFASFLNYRPEIIILTRVEADHLDYFKNFNNVLKCFKKYIEQLPKNGVLIINGNDKNTAKFKNLKLKSGIKIKKYSLSQSEAKKLKKVLKIPGEHNVSNALACLTTARVLNIPDKVSFKALSEYKGSWRRFEEKNGKINNKKIKIISDYAHHPTEVKVTLMAIREKYFNKKIYCLYQPHQYQRTYYLLNDFIKVFRNAESKMFANKIIITDIYDVVGREENEIKNKINSEKLVEKIKRENVIYLEKKQILKYLEKNKNKIQVLIIMGAGDIYKIISKLETRQRVDIKNKITENKKET